MLAFAADTDSSRDWLALQFDISMLTRCRPAQLFNFGLERHDPRSLP